jgi:hypothetical protein
MLFDLQGKRRRVVQATYLILAVLMGGGLVLFGIGSGDISGGLFDALTGKSGNSGGNEIVKKRIDTQKKALQASPGNTAALTTLVRSYYQLATDDADTQTGQFGVAGKQALQSASVYWNQYLDKAKGKPDDSLASLMLQAYSEIGLNKPDDAARAAEVVAGARPSAAAYITLTQFAAKAGQTRKAELAGLKAIELAPKKQRKLVKQQVEAAKVAGLTAQTAG